MLVGQQLVLEGIGEITLGRLYGNMSQGATEFKRVYRRILLQEHAHHCFGVRLLNIEIETQKTDVGYLRDMAAPYLDITDHLLKNVSALFSHLHVDASCLQREVWSGLPPWLNPDTA